MLPLLLLLVAITAASEPVKVDPISGSIYLEHLGDVVMFHKTWTVVNYVDLTEINTYRDELLHIANTLSLVCNSTEPKGKNCLESITIETVRQRMHRIEDRRVRLMNIINYSPRIKRGVFNFIGEISKILFGTLGNSDAEYYNNEMDKIHADNERLSILVSNQTTIVKAMIGTFTDALQGLRNDTNKLYETAYVLGYRTGNNTRDIMISTQVALLETLIDEYSENLNNVLNAVNDGKQGIVHPQILSPADLIKALFTIRTKIISSDTPPVPLEESAFTAIIEISDISVMISNNRFAYVIKVPVVENSVLRAYRLIPILQRKSSGNTFYYLNPPDMIVIVNDVKTLFTPSNEEGLSQCKKLNSKFLCRRRNPDYAINNPSSCEAVILQKPSDISDSQCQVLFINLVKSMWIQLKNGNSWIVTSPETETLHVMCEDGKVYQTTLHGTNKVTISGDCLGQTDHIIIRPRVEKTLTQTTDLIINKTLLTPKLDEILNNHSLALEDLKLTTLGRPTHMDVTHLQTLGQTLTEISDEAQTIGRHRRNKTILQTAYDYFQYFGYSCVVIVMLALAIRCGLCGCLFNVFGRMLRCTFSPCINVYNNCFHSNNVDRLDYQVEYVPEQLVSLTEGRQIPNARLVQHASKRRYSHPKA